MAPLYKSAFGLKTEEKHVKAKFFHPYQVIRSSYLALYKKKSAASFYGIICMQAALNGEKFYIGQSCDSMTHADHTGKKLFITLAEKSYKDIQGKGVTYIFGFPNETIYPLRINKLGWQHTENINVYKQQVKTLPLAKLVKKFPALKALYCSYLSLALRKYKSRDSWFPNSLTAKDVAGIVHDEAYFDYKSTKDKFILNIDGTNFWIKVDGFLWVGDFESVQSEIFPEKLKKLQSIARIIGCTAIVFHYQEKSVNDLLLKNHLKVHSQMPLGFIDLNKEHLLKKFKFAGADFDSW